MRKTMAMALLAATAAFGACDDDNDPNVPDDEMQVVAGSYTALTLNTTETGGVIDWLDAGGILTLNLQANGATTGRLFLPGADEDGSDVDADLTGTWELEDGEVELDHDADTFLRDMEFDFGNGVLTGEEDFGDTTVRVVLSRN